MSATVTIYPSGVLGVDQQNLQWAVDNFKVVRLGKNENLTHFGDGRDIEFHLGAPNDGWQAFDQYLDEYPPITIRSDVQIVPDPSSAFLEGETPKIIGGVITVGGYDGQVDQGKNLFFDLDFKHDLLPSDPPNVLFDGIDFHMYLPLVVVSHNSLEIRNCKFANLSHWNGWGHRYTIPHFLAEGHETGKTYGSFLSEIYYTRPSLPMYNGKYVWKLTTSDTPAVDELRIPVRKYLKIKNCHFQGPVGYRSHNSTSRGANIDVKYAACDIEITDNIIENGQTGGIVLDSVFKETNEKIVIQKNTIRISRSFNDFLYGIHITNNPNLFDDATSDYISCQTSITGNFIYYEGKENPPPGNIPRFHKDACNILVETRFAPTDILQISHNWLDLDGWLLPSEPVLNNALAGICISNANCLDDSLGNPTISGVDINSNVFRGTSFFGILLTRIKGMRDMVYSSREDHASKFAEATEVVGGANNITNVDLRNNYMPQWAPSNLGPDWTFYASEYFIGDTADDVKINTNDPWNADQGTIWDLSNVFSTTPNPLVNNSDYAVVVTPLAPGDPPPWQ